jgi:hypothetical protein
MDFSGTNISISDNDGHLLMYSNGMGVQGKSHTPITGLDSIGYGIFWERFNEKIICRMDQIGHQDFQSTRL